MLGRPPQEAFCSVKYRQQLPGHCLPEDKEIVSIISAPSPPMLNRNRETEFWKK